MFATPLLYQLLPGRTCWRSQPCTCRCRCQRRELQPRPRPRSQKGPKQLFSPRKDNSKGNIIALFNTNGAYQFISINRNAKLNNINDVFG